MPNRLAGATSAYLLQHVDNPVDWWPWGDEAFAEARRRDVPILLSVGYAACHWCHVMAHESFEDPHTAAAMNAGFVAVKVDREERPDVDAVYMEATQALSGQGGWPMTVFLTPIGQPFYAGTYFPPEPVPGRPSFLQVLEAIERTWRERRAQVEESGARIAAALAARSGPVVEDPADLAESVSFGPTEPPTAPRADPLAEVVAAAAARLLATADRHHGGFGGAPKFPPAMDLEFLLRRTAARRLAGDHDGGQELLAVVESTLRGMAHGGLYDQLAGGFARYAVDVAWSVPHFEKMLTDNALLARVYLHWWRLTGDPTGARIAQETCDWMVAALRTPEGGFASSLDADTRVRDARGMVRSVEGFTAVWTPGQLDAVLGPDQGRRAAELLTVTAIGTFERGTSTLHLARDVWADPEQAAWWRGARAALLAARDRRPQPTRDDKVVAAWNGLAIAALAETGALLARPDLVAAAERAADLVVAVHLVAEPPVADGERPRLRLRRVSRDGVAGPVAGVLEDYADTAEGLLTLSSVTGDRSWSELAAGLLDTVLARFDDGRGGFYDTAADATDAALAAVRRPREPLDGAYPSGTSAAAGALLTAAGLTGTRRYRTAARRALGAVARQASAAPRAFGWGLAVAQAWLDGPREVAVVGPDRDPARELLHRTALAGTAPGLVVAVGEATTEAAAGLLADRPTPQGTALAYVCREFVCLAPTTSADALARQVGTRITATETVTTTTTG